MPEKNLPEKYLENMRRLLGEESDSFFASFQEGRKNALRLNRLKITPRQFEKTAPFRVERVPWTDNGYYVDYRDAPGRHPWYRAGVYYLQEPSAMAPAQILPVEAGNRVLDLCAAPGGKATELGARLGGSGLLVANEISASRARALERNIELFGIRNCVVTNETPEKLSERFPEYFDRVLVDAPCSGEGMFRKDLEAARLWSMEKVKECARVQRDILRAAVRMLRPGGFMVYSTCTFEPAENELAIADLLREHGELELLEIPCTGGKESFSRAYSLEELRGKGYEPSFELSGRSGSVPAPDVTRAVRIWPHRASGEGHFIALLRKREEVRETEMIPAGSRSIDKAPGMDNMTGMTGQLPADGNRTGRNRADKSRDGRVKKRRPEKGESGGKPDRRRPDHGELTKQERQLVEQFLKAFCPGQNIDKDRFDVKDGRVYRMPEDCPDIRGLKFLRAGLYLGELKKNRFEPSQELALALLPPAPGSGEGGDLGMPSQAGVAGPVRYTEDDGACICLPSGDERLSAFLRGESVRLEEAGESGWRLVCADRWPVGWGKLVGGVLKNHIPAIWRN